ncbi:cytochrome c and c1 heme-lyase [Saitoella complicata NRRL Y-17804]|uniref:Holocytochrome c-type synthase n=1 Tax=Saitoella complicata (strain BCRC 22490 / CBS 7301 / JCM 7358 / NBRC 10748 / NRRL Y-17804) TaxID=698492 RepID=A0A0E9NFT4_SAICN|nr:cytochrome c and c1 heme-lyase [Saitoella complicata NRRL Y-17804]ODQ54210.1 cytochrome c and c1 heme-lyase [Saitoella complicata NRRL Y-17804]GAO48546.1 hypothetical protein G7K_2719-t1 [Saitoella complicata NRRL Y-17804]
MADQAPTTANQCPVPHVKRGEWLAAAKGAPEQTVPTTQAPSAEGGKCPVPHDARETWLGAGNERSSSPQISPLNNMPVEPQQKPRPGQSASLPTEREISTIPRLESESDGYRGADKGSSNWVYPSEQMFFDAMRRKSWNPDAEDMKVIVPIHNAVNERAWQEIMKWEKPYDSKSCGGPKLAKFEGDASKITPKARLLNLLGYNLPFDRHDWTVDRCGQKVEYVIDFYKGAGENSLSFYLDVRPKFTAEGAKMRIGRFFRDIFA